MMTHDYKRHGTTTLFEALNVLDGQVIAQCQPPHRHTEWLRFLRQIDQQTPPEKILNVERHTMAEHRHVPHRAPEPAIHPASLSGPSVHRPISRIAPALNPYHATAFHRHRVDDLPAQANNPS